MGRILVRVGVLVMGPLAAIAAGTAAQAASSVEKYPTKKQSARPAFTAEERQEIDDFVAGNVLFTLYHEAGHAMVSEFDLPVLGREEDAVDSLAALMMIPEEPDEQQDAWIIAAADWFAMVYELDDSEMEYADYAGEHGLDLQRYYQIICLIYGSDPEGFADLAEYAELPPERAERCPDELAQVARSWVSLLEPHEGKANKPIVVSYGDPGEYDAAAAVLRDSGVMEVVAEELSNTFAFPNQIRMVAEECGMENAFWDPEARTITLCYELVEGARLLIVDDIRSR